MGNCCESGLKLFEDQDYRKIRSDLVKNKELFEDDKFDMSLLPRESRDAVWLRPQEICERFKDVEKEKYGVPEMGPRTR